MRPGSDVRPAGAGVVRVVWLPGSDRLRGTCHCGASTVADGPTQVWEWLFAHPAGHRPGTGTVAEPATVGERR